MSNLLHMDKSNGNGVYASKPSNIDNEIGLANTNTGAASAALATANNISIMNGAAAVAAAAASVATLPASASSEDLSQSLSEYTDADESISAPTEFLAEFLSAVMLKDYKKALKYCKLILQYEPNNATAKEFYPLILDKLNAVATSSDSDENYNKSSSPEMALELQASDSSNNCSEEDNDDDHYDDEEDDNDVDDDDIDNEGVEEEESSSGDDYDLPIDEQQDAAAVGGLPVHTLHSHTHNDSGSSRNSSSGGGGRSDNTTHSYSSLLLEEEDDIVAINLSFSHNDPIATDLDISNGNKIPSASCSDSESPTEPLTQRLAAILRSKCGVSASSNDEQY